MATALAGTLVLQSSPVAAQLVICDASVIYCGRSTLSDEQRRENERSVEQDRRFKERQSEREKEVAAETVRRESVKAAATAKAKAEYSAVLEDIRQLWEKRGSRQ